MRIILDGFRVEHTMADTTTGHPHNQPTTTLSSGIDTRPEPRFRSLVNQLVKSRIHIIRKLYFSNGLHALKRRPNGKPDNTLLSQGRIKHPVVSKLGRQVHAVPQPLHISKALAKQQKVGRWGMPKYLHRNTPPKATSSPNSKTRGSVRSACESAELMAWNRFRRDVVPFCASADSSSRLRADLEVWLSKGVVSKSVGVFRRAWAGSDEYHRGFCFLNIVARNARFIVYCWCVYSRWRTGRCLTIRVRRSSAINHLRGDDAGKRGFFGPRNENVKLANLPLTNCEYRYFKLTYVYIC